MRKGLNSAIYCLFCRCVFVQRQYIINVFRSFRDIILNIKLFSEGINMIKAPITKTGDIRYFEFIKIFVLVSFFIAFTSIIVDQPQFILQISPIVPTTIINVIVLITVVHTIICDLKEIVVILKDVIITYIPSYNIKLKETIMEQILPFISIFKPDLLQSKLCVIRC